MSSSKNPEPDRIDDETPNKPTHTASVEASEYKLEWPNLPIPSKYVRPDVWQSLPCPDVLSQLPPDVIVPEKLQQILAWSLLVGDDWAREPPQSANPSVALDQPEEVQAEIQDDMGKMTPAQHELSSLPESSETVGSTTAIGKPVGKPAWSSKLFRKIGLKTPVTITQQPLIVKVATRECISCFDELPESNLIQLESCRHDYCKPCLTTLITTTMASEASFPPKCCLAPIPLQTILLSLNSKQRAEYKAKSAEYSIPPNERWYCPKTTCSKFIPFLRLKFDRHSNYHCPFCYQKICHICRGEAHARNVECPQDYNLESTLEIAEVEGWVRCYSCRILVEHTSGCRHMTCKCRAEFCYVCGARWATCSCTERDADTKRAKVREQRQLREETLDAEAAEIARAIAEIEEMERQEEEARRLEEERVLREEEEMLAVLEFQRQEEENARVAAAELAEQEWLQMLKSSLDEDCQQTQEVLQRIVEFQKTTLVSQHEAELKREEQEREAETDVITNQLTKILDDVSERYQKQQEAVMTKHEQEINAMCLEQDEEEDTLFVQIQIRLRGKPNREARTERMLEGLRKQYQEQREELQNLHRATIESIRQSKSIDLEGIKRARRDDLNTVRTRSKQHMRVIGFKIGAERHYYELVTRRRLVMLAKHGEILLNQIEQKTELKGLQDWQAVKCMPILPKVDDGAPGPSGIDRGDLELEDQQHPIPGRDYFHGKPRYREPLEQKIPRDVSVETPASVEKTDSEVITPDQRPSGPRPDDESLPEVVVVMPSPERPPPPVPRRQIGDVADSGDIAIDGFRNSMLPPEPVVSDMQRPATQTGNHTMLPCVAGITADLAMAFVSQSQSSEKRNSTTTTIISVGSDERGSIISTGKKSKWSFGKRSKDLTPQEIRQRMRNTVGDAF